MIPFGSQRAYGQDLATHLLNAQDNERLEVAEVRGAVAHDLHGAFAEWEAEAHALTRCTNYLYSLSINPDQRQGRLTKQQYLDYIERAEQRLGLAGQPRAIVFHVKKDAHGVPREHCHVIWSRIDIEQEKARHVAFDYDKLMMVTREFARDYGLRLPDGYYKDKTKEKRRGRQLTLYEKRQNEMGGLPLKERLAQVTAAWERRDTAKSFVRSLEDMGYILCTGRRDYVLVDLYGHMNSLPKLIDDRAVRTKHVREFLGKDFPTDSLPSVEEARALAAAHRAAMALFEKNEQRAAREAKEKHRRDELQHRQLPRRQGIEQEAKDLTGRQLQARKELSERQKEARAALRQGYLQESRRIKSERAASRPTGLAAFLGRITGVELITKKIHQYRDKTRLAAHVTRKRDLTEQQRRDAAVLARRQELETLTMQRRLRALELVEKRELKSLETKLLKERRVEERERTEGGKQPEPNPKRSHEQEFNNAAEKPVDRADAGEASGKQSEMPEPAPDHVGEFNKAAKKPIDLVSDFNKASGSGESEGKASGDAAQDPAPEAEITIQRRRRTRDRSQEQQRNVATRPPNGDHDGDDPSPNDPPRRRRNRDLDRGR